MKLFKLSILLLSLFVFTILIVFQLRPVKVTATAVGTVNFCPPLSVPIGTTVTVNNQADLINEVDNAAANTTILIEPGIYHMSRYLYMQADGVSLRGQSGNRGDVILDFGGMINGHFGILVAGEADDVTIADLTIRNASDHGVAMSGGDRALLYNLHIYDINDQLVKVSSSADGSHDGVLACSRMEYTTTAPDSYTNGISAHNAHNWLVRDNEWVRILTDDGTPVPAVLFWNDSSNTVVERNYFLDCSRGVAFGLSDGHTGGIVRNNMFLFREPHDVAIEMSHAAGWLVAHNTAVLLNPNGGLTWSMEARFDDTQGSFAYNLTNMPVWSDRDGAQATETGNEIHAQSSWFVDLPNGDLHLAASATAVIDQAQPLMQVPTDFDGDPRLIGGAPDIGADEYGVFAPTDFVYLPLIVR